MPFAGVEAARLTSGAMADSFRAFTATQDGDAVTRAIGELSVDDLPADGLLVSVERSSVNYKDGLATIPKGRAKAF